MPQPGDGAGSGAPVLEDPSTASLVLPVSGAVPVESGPDVLASATLVPAPVPRSSLPADEQPIAAATATHDARHTTASILVVLARFTNGRKGGSVGSSVRKGGARVLVGWMFLAAAVFAISGAAQPHDAARNGAPRRVTIYLHRDGGRIEAGSDDARARVSSSVERAGLPHVDVPPFDGDDAAWTELVRCVEGVYVDFDVEIVDTEPSRGQFILAAIGGTPDLFGFEASVGGVAPYDGRLDSKSVVFAFQRPGDDLQSICVTAAHEIGHALGLDHTLDCDDVMSYLDCGEKGFKDAPMACGEWQDRPCTPGDITQNSWARLASTVGPRRL
jgi:hypothetical protein